MSQTMNKLRTVFQNLDKTIGGGWGDGSNRYVGSYDLSNMGNTVLYRTTDKEDYERKKLELKQQNYLNSLWRTSNRNLNNNSLNGLSAVKMMYRDVELMSCYPEIGAALDLYANEAAMQNQRGNIINVYSDSKRIKSIIEDLLVNRLDIQVTSPMIIRALCKYGNQFMLLNIKAGQGVCGWRQLPPAEVERIEDGVLTPYASAYGNRTDTDGTTFVWMGNQSANQTFRNWQIAHFRLLEDSIFLPYGCVTEDTLVSTVEGEKPIKDLEIGDEIYTYSVDSLKKELSKVTMKMNKGVKPVFKVATLFHSVEATSDHKFLIKTSESKYEYKELQELKIGDELVIHSDDNTPYTEDILFIEPTGEKTTYDITVESSNSNFYANGVVVHNCSILHKARRHWRLLSLMEDSMLIYRLERSVERRVYKIYVGAIDDADVQGYVEDIANSIKRTPIVDPATGQIDLRKNILPVHKDTPIPLLDGRTITIEEVAKEYEEGKQNYVYSIQDKSLNIVPGKVVWCGKNYTADKLVKITLDDNTHVIMAPEHELIMRDGSKKRADEVIEGESVMPFYTNKERLSELVKAKYETVYNPKNGIYQFTHRLVANEIPKDNDKQKVIHHKGVFELNNRFNNSPDNLVWMTWEDHNNIHRSFSTDEQLHTVIEKASKSWEGEGRTNRVKQMTTYFDDYVWNEIEKAVVEGKVYNRTTLLDFINTELIDYLIEINQSEKLSNNRSVSRFLVQTRLKERGYDTISNYLEDVAARNNSKSPKEIYSDILRQKAFESGFNNYVSNLNSEEMEEYKKKLALGKSGLIPKKVPYSTDSITFDDYVWDEIRRGILENKLRTREELLNYINDNLIDYLKEHSDNPKLHKLGKINESILYRRVKEKYNVSVGKYIENIRRNHKIKKVEWVSGDDVYCMTVEGLNGEQDRHNFAICSWNEDKTYNRSGIFVSNCVDQDLFIPVRDANAPTPIDTLPAGQNLTAIDDIKYIQNKVLAGLGVPKAFLNFEEATGDGKNLALMDVRFARVITRIQQAFLMELTKVVTIHLYLLGFREDLTNFTLTMNNPSTQAEQLEIENLSKKIAAVRDAVSDPGNGIPVMSMIRAWKEIMKYNDAEIKDMLEEIRLEKALAAELEKTSQIIKRTKIFDTVDKIYGEPGAEYQEDNAGGMPGADGGFAGGGGGGAALGGGGFGDGLDNLGDPGNTDNAGDISGAEGSTDANNIPGENQQPTNNQNESSLRLRKNKPLLNERIHLTNIFFDLLMERLNHPKNNEEEDEDSRSQNKIQSLEKSSLIQEEYTNMMDELDKIIKD